MAIEIVSLYVLGLIAVGVISYLAGRWKGSDAFQLADAKATSLEFAYKQKCRDCNELNTALLRVNKLNKELNEQIKETGTTYENCADDMVTMLNMGFSRHGIAKKYNIPYPTACFWLRKKQKELENERVHNVYQNPLV